MQAKHWLVALKHQSDLFERDLSGVTLELPATIDTGTGPDQLRAAQRPEHAAYVDGVHVGALGEFLRTHRTTWADAGQVGQHVNGNSELGVGGPSLRCVTDTRRALEDAAERLDGEAALLAMGEACMQLIAEHPEKSFDRASGDH